MKFNNIIILILFIIIFGCNPNNFEIKERIDKDGYKYIGRYENNIKNGFYKVYSKSGKLVRSFYYKNNLQDGWDTSFYESGQLLNLSFYIGGRQEGMERQYFQNGNTFEISSYKNGILDGIDILFNKDGQIKNIANLKNGKRSGISYEFNNSGKLIKLREYVVLKGTSELNQLLYYDDRGCLLTNVSRFLEIRTRDTIQKGEKYLMEFNFTRTYKNVNIYIGDFDKDYNCQNCKMDTFSVFKLPCKIEITPKKIGNNVIHGRVDMYQHITTLYIGIAHQYYYFTKSFFVF